MHILEDKLETLLLTSGIIGKDEFTVVKSESHRSGQSISTILVGTGKISEDYLTELLEEYYGVKTVNLKKVTIEPATLESVPELYAKTKRLVVFEHDEKSRVVKVAMLDPFDYDAIEYVRARLGAWVEPYLTTTANLRYVLRQYQRKMGKEFNDIIKEHVEDSLSVAENGDVSKNAASVPIISILDTLMEHAVTTNASDIHFEPLEKGLLVRFRVDGIMQEIVEMPQIIAPILVARVKILGNLQIDEHRIPQDGRFRFEIEDGSNIDIRVNIMPVFHGEKVEMRLLRSSARPLTLSDLGLAPQSIDLIMSGIKKPHGLVLVTGPTGHGKTTTLYAILHILNTPHVNITTIEDPIEYEFPRVNQTQVNAKAGITFANGLRALLRQNPDIIMIGEIRDNDTVDIAIHAALTGHLVLSSLHTNDAPAALPRLVDMGAPSFLLSGTVNLVVAQRLVRKICTSCINSYPLPDEMGKLIKQQIKILGDNHIRSIPKTLYKGKGCNVCGMSGFQGQIGIFEVFEVNDAIREMVLRNAPISEIRTRAIKDGMITMFEDGLKKVELGVTTAEEVLRVVRE